VITRRRVVYTVLLTVAAVAFVAAFLIHPEPTTPDRPPAVVAVSPEEGATALRQSEIFAELGPDFAGELVFDGKAIPMDQLDVIQTGNVRLSFTPGAGKEFTAFPVGRHCATVMYYPRAEGPASTTSYGWCFELH
jgi:hypothetical protein